MQYPEFLNGVTKALKQKPSGLTWEQLRKKLKIENKVPDPTWVNWMRHQVGLVRIRRKGKPNLWMLLPGYRRRSARSYKTIPAETAEEKKIMARYRL